MAIERVPKGTTDLTGIGADTNELHFVEGNQTISAGLDKSGLTEGYSKIVVAETFTGNIGGASGAFQADCDSGSAVFYYHAGGGSCYYRPKGDDNLCDAMEIISAGSMYLTGGGTVTECGLARGNLNCSDSVIITNLRQSGGNTNLMYHATALTALTLAGGQFLSQRSCTTGTFANRVNAIFKREDTSGTVGAATTLNIYDANVKWCLGNITTVNLLHPNASIDFSEAPADLTLGTLNGFGQAIARSRLSSKLATVTVSAQNPYIGSADYWKSIGTGGGYGGGFGT